MSPLIPLTQKLAAMAAALSITLVVQATLIVGFDELSLDGPQLVATSNAPIVLPTVTVTYARS